MSQVQVLYRAPSLPSKFEIVQVDKSVNRDANQETVLRSRTQLAEFAVLERAS
ncbi:MAG: hypothetical protein ACPG8A_08270 [Psychrobium sp.]